MKADTLRHRTVDLNGQVHEYVDCLRQAEPATTRDRVAGVLQVFAWLVTGAFLGAFAMGSLDGTHPTDRRWLAALLFMAFMASLALSSWRRQLKTMRILASVLRRFGYDAPTMLDAKRWLLERWLGQPPHEFLKIAADLTQRDALLEKLQRRPANLWLRWWKRLFDPDSKARLVALIVAPCVALIVTLGPRGEDSLGEIISFVVDGAFAKLWGMLFFLAAMTLAIAAAFYDEASGLVDRKLGQTLDRDLRQLIGDLVDAYQLKVNPAVLLPLPPAPDFGNAAPSSSSDGLETPGQIDGEPLIGQANAAGGALGATSKSEGSAMTYVLPIAGEEIVPQRPEPERDARVREEIVGQDQAPGRAAARPLGLET